MTTLERVCTYVVWTIENHLGQWKHSLWIEDLEDDKKIKTNKSYKTLQQDERAKYTPKKPNYTSSGGTKRVYRNLLGSDKGKKRFEETKKHWKLVWEDKRVRAKLTEAKDMREQGAQKSRRQQKGRERGRGRGRETWLQRSPSMETATMT